MSIQNLESALDQVDLCVAIAVLQAHPEWTLAQVATHIEGPHGAVLAKVTVQDLFDDERAKSLMQPDDGGPLIDRRLLERAQTARLDEFDRLVLKVLEAAREPVTASYLRARVGGPRWKLQSACKRLVDAGRVVRRGVTSSTTYEAA